MASEQLIGELLELLRLLRWFTHPVRRGEITPEQYWLLRLLGKSGPLSVGGVASRLGIGQSAATTACKRLERQGLITRTRKSDDERVVPITLTSEGTARIERWAALMHDTAAQILAVLSPQEQSALEGLLVQVRVQAERIVSSGTGRVYTLETRSDGISWHEGNRR